MDNANWNIQSVETDETVLFIDAVNANQVGLRMPADDVAGEDELDSATLSEFLARPVRIATRNWAISDADYTKVTISPWQLFLSNPRVQKKISNFAYIRGNLKIRVLCNASPFYYGAMRVCYKPLPYFKEETVRSTGLQSLIPLSQRSGFMIRAGLNEAYEMTLPFFLPYNKLDVASILNGGTAATDMGYLDYVIFSSLNSANGVATATVTVDTYAWMEDLELTSYTLAPQSKEEDEYGQGVVSKPATALAAAMIPLKTVPVIGKFATATEIGARAVAHIASLFGYTNVPVISDTTPVRSGPFPNLASTDMGFPIEKLTLDSKAELSVAPTALGLGNEDELSIVSLCTKESFLTSVPWSTTNAEDDLLFSARVTPLNYSSNGDAANTVVDMTPSALVACMYKEWRGDLIYRFDVIASPYHKGRLIISHDPTGNSTTNILNTASTSNAVKTAIVDISETTSFEMRVPYQQPTAYRYTRSGVNSSFLTSSYAPWRVGGTAMSYTTYDDANGFITLRVQTVLTAPVAVAPVDVLVSVRCADNIEFANPANPPLYLSPFQAQSEEKFDTTTPATSTMVEASGNPRVERNRLYFGESTASVRSLLRRSSYVGSRTYSSSGTPYTSGDWLLQFRHRRLPPVWGYDTTGWAVANAIVGTGTRNFNFVNPTPMTWLMHAFVGFRGSINWTYDVSANGKPLTNISVIRDPGTASPNSISLFTATSSATISERAWLDSRRSSNTFSGTTLTNQYTQAGVNVSIPNYTHYKFQTTNPSTYNNGSSTDGSQYESVILEIKDSNAINPSDVVIHQYAGVGADFNLHYFLNVPTLYNYGAYPSSG